MNTISYNCLNRLSKLDKPPSILVADDSSSARYVLNNYLTEAGFKVDMAKDGVEALDKALSRHHDAIITDIDMPHMDGFQLCTKLRQNENTAHIPIIVLSTLTTDAHIERGFAVGADAYLSKDGKMSDNIMRIIDLLDAHLFLTGSHILVVDDSPSIRNFIQQGLTQEGFVVSTADNGFEAFEMLYECRPELILTDVMMPKMDGCQLCKAIKKSEFSSIPVVFMSNENDRPLIRQLLRQGAASYLIKPFTVSQLTVIIEQVFNSLFREMLEERERLQIENKTTLSAISSLVQALEARDSSTAGHSSRVAAISIGIGLEMGFTQDQLNGLHVAGQLHDLGKIGVRDSVLLKEGKLEPDEYEHIKSHVKIVEEILKPIDLLSEILEVSVHHHERWDGGGYPSKLKGHEIPLEACIVAVADAFEAMTAKRPYREPMSKKRAVKILLEERGRQFCPQCVDAFLRWFKKTDGIIP
ncbi:response regulator [Pseudodesulfovibrio sp. zrk46]|uniref:response regulator n=1 Tax=Pseudodesulfovibrio sp. zrk46 TaxID=2725288 RepID=UPI001449A8C1|nr:response regulator [Pseudodesulfovibrio sp. zrk46]QJB57644.1 response regulator [Pseudodesulfovibrio sp. zrk46]